MHDPSDTDAQGIALFDQRPFFEKALQYGIAHGILLPERLERMCEEAPKGMVQIARYFGTEFLRPELELARTRMVNLISLYLEQSCHGALDQAALALRGHTLQSRSKGGSDMLRALIAMPQHSHFDLQEQAGFQDEQIPLLAKWSLRSLAEYRSELASRTQIALLVDAARWLADRLGLPAAELASAGVDAEAVIRTALLARLARRSTMPDWPGFEKWIVALRKKYPPPTASAPELAVPLPRDLPAQYLPVVDGVRQSVVSDLARILDPALPIRRLFARTPAFVGRYFWCEDALAEVDDFERRSSTLWDKATGGHRDDGSLLTLFLRIAIGASHTTLLTRTAAASLLRKARSAGLDCERPRQFIRQHAPHELQDDYVRLWDGFAEEAEPLLRSDQHYAHEDALALLRRECNVAP